MSWQQTRDELLEQAKTLATRAGEASVASTARDFAEAARHLAEAARAVEGG